jgi:hypothetical protein
MAVLRYGACIRFLTTSGGTGALAIGNSPAGYLDPFTAGMSSGDRSTWRCESEDGLTWELFEGVVTAGSPSTVSRARIVRTSAGNNTAIAWPNGTTKRVTGVFSPDRTAVLDSDGKLPAEILPGKVSQLFRAAPQSVPHNTGATIVWDTFGINTLGAASATPVNQMIVPETGIYLAIFNAFWAASAAGSIRSALLSIAGVERAGSNAPPMAQPGRASCSFVGQMTAGQSVQGNVFQDSGAALAYGQNGAMNLTLTRIG